MENKKDILSETVINGSRVFIENGDVKVEFSEEIQRTGYMTVEEAKEITLDTIRKIYAMDDNESPDRRENI